jgi:PAS domain S-box-containing protein
MESPAPSTDWTIRYDAVFCIFAAATAYLWGDNGDIVLPQALYLIAVFLVLNLSASLALKRWPTVEWLAALIISANCGVVTALLAYSGGIDSNLWVLYILPVTAACIMLGGRAAALVTLGALGFISVYYAVEGRGYGPAVWLEVGLKDAVLVFIAFTVWRLAGRARLARGEGRVQGLLRETAEQRVDLFRLLLDDSPDAIFIADAATGRLLDYNRGTEEFTKYSRAELSGLRVLDVDAGPILRERGWQEAMQVLRKLGKVTYETELCTRGGCRQPAEVSLGFIPLAGRDYLIAVARDTRHRRLAEEERRHARAMEAASRLAVGVAQSVDTILTSVVERAAPRLKEAPLLLQAAERTAKLTKSLLAFGARHSAAPAAFDLSVLLEKMRGYLNVVVPESIELVVEASGWVPMRAVREEIQQVIVDLVRNASDAMPEGGMLSIAASWVRLMEPLPGAPQTVAPGDYVRLRITDSGVGMDTRTRERLFEPFFPTKRELGAGLGLATVYAIIRRNNGCIQVRSEPDHGTEISVYWPSSAG